MRVPEGFALHDASVEARVCLPLRVTGGLCGNLTIVCAILDAQLRVQMACIQVVYPGVPRADHASVRYTFQPGSGERKAEIRTGRFVTTVMDDQLP